MKHFLFLFLIFSAAIFSQEQDSTNLKNIFITDTTVIVSDSLQTADSLKMALRDTLKPIFQKPLGPQSLILERQNFIKQDYRYTGDYLKSFPFNFVKDLGFIGYPNETYLYGIGNGGISFLVDGVQFNDRIANSTNLNLMQSESIDSIEIVPLPRGFLYSPYNNIASVNFITRDFISTKPYSRIKYYQGPDREAFVNGSFNALVMKRLVASFDISNRITDGSFTNSDFSIWQLGLRLRYLLSNDVNLIASYNLNDYKIGYNGGIDINSLDSLTSNPSSLLFDPDFAPVNYTNGELKTYSHLPRLKVLASLTDWLKTDANMYYKFTRNEFKGPYNSYLEEKTYGLNLNNKAVVDILEFDLNIGYEHRNDYSSQLVIFNPLDDVSTMYIRTHSDVLSFAGIATANAIKEKFKVSLFYKYSRIKNKIINSSFYYPSPILHFNYTSAYSYNTPELESKGLGVDLKYLINDNVNVYAGYSVFGRYSSSLDGFDDLLAELGVNYKNEFVNSSLKYFINESSIGFYTGGNFYTYYGYGNLSGAGLNLSANYCNILFESVASYYMPHDDKELRGVPEFRTQTGLYFKNILFQNNLDLKTGFLYTHTGKNSVYSQEYGSLDVPSSDKLDFVLIGEIQKLAIIYFVWENLLNEEYYITPYFPMPSRNIRFGLAWELFN